MKKLIAGTVLVTIGIGMGMAMGASAAHAGVTVMSFLSARDGLTMNRQFVAGYAEGVSDAMSAIRDELAGAEGSEIADVEGAIAKTATCLEQKGRTANQLTDWAIRQWRHSGAQHNYSAADVMLGDACQ
jgi:hypothetical protein